MVRVKRNDKDAGSRFFQKIVLLLLFVLGISVIIFYSFASPDLELKAEEEFKLAEILAEKELNYLRIAVERNVHNRVANNDNNNDNSESVTNDQNNKKDTILGKGERSGSISSLSSNHNNCPYKSLSDLTSIERYPKATSTRHMVNPPIETDEYGVTLVCCVTTAGPWNILVHHSWAPYGARRFLDMIESKYFEQTVPLMRCVNKFLCQFGLNGIPDSMKQYEKSIPDDVNWLPEGKDNRQNNLGIKRFQKGYMAYAGAGPNSRNLQFIVALNDNGPLAGGSPWEVPWGELVGKHSYETLSKIYTGYGEKGPKQGLLWRVNSLEKVKKNFPKLDYINTCTIIDRAGGQGIPGSTTTDSLLKQQKQQQKR